MPTYAVPNEQQVRRRPAGLRRALPGDDPADAHVSKEGTFLERRRAEWRTLLEVVWRAVLWAPFSSPFRTCLRGHGYNDRGAHAEPARTLRTVVGGRHPYVTLHIFIVQSRLAVRASDSIESPFLGTN